MLTIGSIEVCKRSRIDSGCLKAKSAIMTPARYDRRFVAQFLAQLEDRNWPSYPGAPWFAALREADHVQPCNQPAPVITGDQLSLDTRYCAKSGVPVLRVEQ